MSKKLLLADDSVVIQKLVGLSFANEDFEIVSTDNGDDAVSMAREIQPDVVLADVVMPGLSGYEVCEAIRQDPALAQIPVLLLTGTFEAFDEGRAEAAGANGQITKPFEAQALVERVNEVMATGVPAPAAASEPQEVEAAPGEVATPLAAPDAAEAAPAIDADATVVTSLGSTPESADLFGANDGALGGDAPSGDLTPQLDASEQRSVEFFGAPGDGAAEELDQSGGSMALGQTMSGDDAEDDATVVAVPAIPADGLPPIAAPQEGPIGSPTSAASSDPFERPVEDESPADPLPTARPVDLDAALDAVPIDEDSTILVATDELNASTSPNLSDPLADLDGGQPSGGFEDLTVHVPSADIDQDGATAPTPDVMADTETGPETAPVADLDAALAAEPVAPPAPATDAFGPIDEGDGQDGEATVVQIPEPADLDATVVQIAEDVSTTDVTDPLGLAPASATSDEVDFAFDVSEQVGLDESQSANPNEDSFSSLMDISESAILGGTTPTPDLSDEAPPAPEPAAETIVAGYDVSSSDLATAPGAEASAAPPPVPEPEPEPLIEVPELPDAYQPAPPADADAEPVTGSPDLFDDLATGSPLDEVSLSDAFASAADLAVGDDLLAPDLSADLDDPADEPAEEAPAAAPIELPETDEVFAIGSAPSEPDVDQPISDLSPIMEQRIHETLEKVAWEAFSDLSESIVKQVIGRVEEIAWEVIPEMAETLVREEIRKMKGDDD